MAARQRFEKLFRGQHKDLYPASPGRYQMVRYIGANFAGLISRLPTHLLSEGQPDFVACWPHALVHSRLEPLPNCELRGGIARQIRSPLAP